MKKEIAMKWVAALRSGEYKQARRQLRKNTKSGEASFCCLGVLCNLHAMEFPLIAECQTNPEYYLGENAVLSNTVKNWAGMQSDNGFIFKTCDCLASKNDRGASFKQIANIIEKNYEEL